MNDVVDAFTVSFSQRELDVIRGALRMLEDSHKRNDFPALIMETQDLRSKVNDALIMGNLNRGV